MPISEISSIINKAELQNTKVIKDGSTVLVRVNKDLGNNKYEGSVSGVKINFSSKNPLAVGSSFIANITKVDGKIVLFPKNEAASNNQLIQKNNILNVLLENLGISPDSISLHILKQIKQLQLPLESSNIRKVFNQSSKIKGKEKSISDLLLLFQEKNLFLSQEEVFALLDFLDGDFDNDEAKDKINQLNEKTGAWYIFPYNMIESRNNEKVGKGLVKLFFDNCNDLKVLNLICKYKTHTFYFNLNYGNKELLDLKYFIDQTDDFSDIQKYLQKIFPDVEISACEPDNMDITGCENQDFYSIEGEV